MRVVGLYHYSAIYIGIGIEFVSIALLEFCQRVDLDLPAGILGCMCRLRFYLDSFTSFSDTRRERKRERERALCWTLI